MIEYLFFAPFKLTQGKPVQLPGGNKLVFLSLHRVRPAHTRSVGSNSFLDISADKLESLIVHLKKLGATFVSGDNFDQQHDDAALRVHITLDDGYKDNLEHAFPVFEKHKIPFTLFLTTGIPDREAVLWWYLIEDILANGKHLRIPAFNIDINAKNMSQEKQLDTFEFLRKFFLENYAAFKDLIDDALQKAGANNQQLLDAVGLTWSDVRTLAKSRLCTLGNHTRHHFCMSKLPHQAILAEVDYAQQRIEQETGQSPVALAFPFGAKDDIVDLSKVSGFRLPYVFSTETGIIRNFNRVDKFNIPRYFLNNGITPFALNMMINGMRHRVNRLLY